MKRKELKTILILVSTVVFSQITWANSTRDLVLQANKLYDKGNFNEALKEYDQALVDQPQALEPKFNKANCYFKLDDLAKAVDLYNEVAAESKDMKLVAKAKYNLGNCYFKQGSKQKDSNLQKALEDLQTSIVCWRSALEVEPENDKAAKNIEVARLIIKDIIDQINKQKQEQQQQAEKQKQLQEKLKQLAERQKALAKKTQQINSDANEGKISRQQAQDSYKQQAQQQSQLSSETDQTLKQMQQQDPNIPQPPQMQQAAEELQQAASEQFDAENKLNASEGAAAKQSQDKAAQHLENALKSLSQDNQQSQSQGQQQQQEEQAQTQQPPEPNQPGNEQQKQKAQQAVTAPDTTAQQILDKEQKQKRQRQILQRGGYQKVEKDW